MMMPANWQAQCRVAASQRFCSAVTMMVAGLQAERVEARDDGRDAPVPLRIGEPHVAVDDRERVRIARDAGDEAGAEIKHRAASSRHRARPRRSARSRCSGRCGRSGTRAAPSSLGSGMLAQIPVERHQDAGGAEAALQRVMAAERLLQHREPAGLRREPLDGADASRRRPARRASGRRAPARRRSGSCRRRTRHARSRHACR